MPHLVRNVAWALAAKLVALTALYFLFFGPAHQPQVNPSAIAAQLLGGDAVQATR